MAALAFTPESGSITATKTVVRVNVTEALASRAPDATGGEYRYYIAFLLDSVQHGKSYVFGVSSDGKHEFNSYVFPEAGSWTVNLCDVEDDSTIATASVTVS